MGSVRDRNGKQRPVGQTHGFQDALIVGLGHEAVQGGEGPDGQTLEIAQGAVRNLQRRQSVGLLLEFLETLRGDQKIDQLAPVG